LRWVVCAALNGARRMWALRVSYSDATPPRRPREAGPTRIPPFLSISLRLVEQETQHAPLTGTVPSAGMFHLYQRTISILRLGRVRAGCRPTVSLVSSLVSRAQLIAGFEAIRWQLTNGELLTGQESSDWLNGRPGGKFRMVTLPATGSWD
jgi:hypothetical protein